MRRLDHGTAVFNLDLPAVNFNVIIATLTLVFYQATLVLDM